MMHDVIDVLKADVFLSFVHTKKNYRSSSTSHRVFPDFPLEITYIGNHTAVSVVPPRTLLRTVSTVRTSRLRTGKRNRETNCVVHTHTENSKSCS